MSLRPRAVPAPKAAVLILGVGRSGTSALTRMLNLLGATLPRSLLEPGYGNERGFWEPSSIVAINEEMLASQGSHWHDSRAFPKDWFSSIEAKDFIGRTAAVIEREYKGASLIAIKDPRICRLAPIYLAALDDLDYAPKVILPLRAPSEMIASLKQRDGTDPRIGELIWVRHMLESEAATRDYQRIWVAYDQLLTDWRGLQARIAAKLELVWPNAPEIVAGDVAAFLDPGLRHFDERRNLPVAPVGSLAAAVWRAARSGLNGDEQTTRRGFDELRWIIDEIDRLGACQAEQERAQRQALVAEVDDLEDKLDACRTAETAARREADTLRSALADRDAALAALRAQAEQALLSAQQALSDTASAAAAINDALAARQTALEARLAESESRLNAVVRSRSWKVTRPLRSVYSTSRALFGVDRS